MAEKKPRPEATEFQVDLEADTWAASEAPPPGLLARLSAEFFGTFIFMLIGLGVAFFGLALSTTAATSNAQDPVGLMGVLAGQNLAASLTYAFAWAVALIALVVAFKRISGAHFNPAVTIGAWIAGRFPGRDVALYIVVQTAGAIGAAGLLYWLAGGFTLFSGGTTTVGQGMSAISIGSGVHSPTGTPLDRGLVIEFIATALLVGIVLAATSVKAPKSQAPFTIGLSFGVLLLLAGPLTGGAINPARATATALFATDASGTHWALGQLVWWWVATIVAGAFIGLLVRAFGPEEDLDMVEVIEVIEA
jgi:aquaporin Z